MQDVYKNIEEKSLCKKCKILIVFDVMIADMINNKTLNPIITKLFLRTENETLFLFLLHNSIFKVPNDVRLNSTQFLS